VQDKIRARPAARPYQFVKGLKKYELFKSLRGELDGGRSPASNEMNSRQSLAEHGFGERSDFFRENTLLRKNRRFETVKKVF
jgi:hypothetical protein